MCIICNCGEKGFEFVEAFSMAKTATEKAKNAMIECSRSVPNKIVSKQYDAIHKKMVGIIKEFKRLEVFREVDVVTINVPEVDMNLYEYVFEIDTDKAVEALGNGEILPEYINYYLKRKELNND